MAKPDKPLLSLGARGTIADTLTYQRRGREHIVREKPIPKDPYSLNQAYQRWDYRDYAYLWTLLSNSEKQVYRTAASRYHITGFSLWMREHLRDLPDIAARWHLDEKSGAVAFDSSKNANNGVIIGASPATGLIDNAYSFDGLNDTLRIPDAPSLNPLTYISLDFFIKLPASFPASAVIFSKLLGPINQYYCYFYSAGNYFIFIIGNVWACRLQAASVKWGDRNHISFGGTFGTNNWYVFVDGVDRSTHHQIAPLLPTTGFINLASHLGGSDWANIDLDHFTIYNRLQDATEAKRHSLRRYPA